MLDEHKHLEQFSEDDVCGVIQDELTMDIQRYRQHNTPKAILLAGQPGAGKTELSAMMVSLLDNDAVFINADDFRRYHPSHRLLHDKFGPDAVQMTAAFSAAVTERLIHALSDLHVNLVIEGTGRTVDVPKRTAELLVSKGYTVELAVIAVRPIVSLTSTLLRFYQMNERGTLPRATTMSAHDCVVDALPDNLDILCKLPCISRLTIWDRELSQLYDSQSVLMPSSVLAAYWHRPWTDEEIIAEETTIQRLREKELASRLGQSPVIDELERRFKMAIQ